jgi:hypothetical protein
MVCEHTVCFLPIWYWYFIQFGMRRHIADDSMRVTGGFEQTVRPVQYLVQRVDSILCQADGNALAALVCLSHGARIQNG